MFYLQQDLLPQQPGEQGPCPVWDTPFPAGVVMNEVLEQLETTSHRQ